MLRRKYIRAKEGFLDYDFDIFYHFSTNCLTAIQIYLES